MGIAVKELLTLEYFKDYHVIAGKSGLHKEIQGTTLLEAPDALRWAKGKELVLSSGYVLAQEPDCLEEAFKSGSMQGTSAMMIKRGRYLDEIPQRLIDLFDQYEIPLISMPFSVPWMELMSQINTAVMNRTIRRFKVHSNNHLQVSDQSYKVQKINKILRAVEVEMKFPAFIYDLAEEKSYYSSPDFKRITESFGLSESDYWEPSMPYTKHTLCDYINMARIQGISVNTAYQYIVFHQCNEGYNARNERNTFLEAFQQSKLGKIGKIAFLDENDGLILLEAEKIHNSIPWTKDTTTELLKEFQRYIGLKFADMRLEFGICQEEKTLLEVRECVKKCQKVLKMGSIIFPEKDIWEYEMLGPLTWIEIPENELKEMLRKYRELMEEEKNIELLKTLKIYLENNMNYSVTAEKMYVHINTIRKRIDKVNDLVKIDWEDHVDRLKMEILLQFLGL